MKFSFWIDDGEVMNESDLVPSKGRTAEGPNFARASEAFLDLFGPSGVSQVDFIAFCHDNKQWATGTAEQRGWGCLGVDFTSFDALLEKVG
jgi:hypothetical protein